MPGGVRRVPSARDVRAAEKEEKTWAYKAQLPMAAISMAIVMPALLAWLAYTDGPWWYWLLAAAMPLLGVYGVWELKRLGPRRKRRRGATPPAGGHG